MYWFMALAVVLAVVADQLVKLWVVQSIPLHTVVEAIPGLFHFTYVQNTGAAFSALEGQTWLFALVFLAFTAAIVWEFSKKRWGFTNFERWLIAAIYAGTRFSVGLKTDGTVVFAGNCGFDCSGWKHIDNLAAGDFFLLGLNEEGTVLSIGVEEAIGPNTPGVIAQWENISQIAAGNDHIVAVTADGKILCAGKNDYRQLHVEGFTITCPKPISLP